MSDRRYTLFDLKNIQAPNFLMTPLELHEYIDFPVKRVYFISSPINQKMTGNHAHRQEEDEIFIMVQGSCIIAVDDGHGMEDITLTGPKTAIRIPHMVWHGFKSLSDNAIIFALTSTNYDPTRSDYCENYQEFQQLINQSKAA